METLIMLLIGVGLVYLIRIYHWCILCKEKASQRGSDLCVTCAATAQNELDDLLKKRG